MSPSTSNHLLQVSCCVHGPLPSTRHSPAAFKHLSLLPLLHFFLSLSVHTQKRPWCFSNNWQQRLTSPPPLPVYLFPLFLVVALPVPLQMKTWPGIKDRPRPPLWPPQKGVGLWRGASCRTCSHGRGQGLQRWPPPPKEVNSIWPFVSIWFFSQLTCLFAVVLIIRSDNS